MDQQLCNQHVMFIMTTYDQFSCVKETFLELHVQVPAKKIYSERDFNSCYKRIQVKLTICF